MEKDQMEMKRKYVRILNPILEMMKDKKDELPPAQWMSLIENIKSRIVAVPDQYLGTEVPQRDILSSIIDSIFDDLVQSH